MKTDKELTNEFFTSGRVATIIKGQEDVYEPCASTEPIPSCSLHEFKLKPEPIVYSQSKYEYCPEPLITWVREYDTSTED